MAPRFNRTSKGTNRKDKTDSTTDKRIFKPMVAKIASGKSFNGALSYNENKVAEGKATLLMAINYPKDAEELSFQEKLNRLNKQADLNQRIEHKCVHISLNFDPTEHFS